MLLALKVSGGNEAGQVVWRISFRRWTRHAREFHTERALTPNTLPRAMRVLFSMRSLITVTAPLPRTSI